MLAQHGRRLLKIRNGYIGLLALALLSEVFAQTASSPEAHKSLDLTSERVRLSEILISTPLPYSPQQVDEARHQAAEVRETIRAGGSFSELAKTNSQGPTAYLGGDLGYFPHGVLAPSIESIVFGMKIGDVSEVIRTKQGFVIIELTERLAPGVPPDDNWALVNTPLTPEIKGYVDKILPTIRQHWFLLIPDSARAPLMKRGSVSVNVAITRDGKPHEARITSASGSSDLDEAALKAVSELKQLPPFPDTVQPRMLELRINFFYNPEKPIKEGSN